MYFYDVEALGFTGFQKACAWCQKATSNYFLYSCHAGFACSFECAEKAAALYALGGGE